MIVRFGLNGQSMRIAKANDAGVAIKSRHNKRSIYHSRAITQLTQEWRYFIASCCGDACRKCFMRTVFTPGLGDCFNLGISRISSLGGKPLLNDKQFAVIKSQTTLPIELRKLHIA